MEHLIVQNRQICWKENPQALRGKSAYQDDDKQTWIWHYGIFYYLKNKQSKVQSIAPLVKISTVLQKWDCEKRINSEESSIFSAVSSTCLPIRNLLVHTSVSTANKLASLNVSQAMFTQHMRKKKVCWTKYIPHLKCITAWLQISAKYQGGSGQQEFSFTLPESLCMKV